MAREIGAARDLDCFLLAYLFVSIPVHFLFPAMGSAFVPFLLEREKVSREEGHQVLGGAFSLSLALVLVTAVLIVLAGKSILSFAATGFSEDEIEVVSRYATSLLPFLFSGAAAALLGAFLNARGKNLIFSTFHAAPAMATGIFLLFGLWNPPIENQIWGHNIGMMLVVPLMWFSARAEGLHLSAGFSWASHLKPIIGQWGPMVLGQSFVAFNIIVDTAMASGFGSGSVAVLDYGTKLFAVFSTLSMTTLSILLYPRFARMAADREYRALRAEFVKGTKIVFAGAIIVAIGVWILAEFGVRLAFERGAFTPEKTVQTAEILRLYVLGLPMQLATIMGTRVLAAIKGSKYLTYLGLLSLVCNVFFNLLFTKVMGLSGLALSTSAVALIVGAATFLTTLKQVRRRMEQAPL